MLEGMEVGLQFVTMLTICALFGLVGANQLRLFTMVTAMSKIQAELVIEVVRLRQGVPIGMHDWRQLPPEARPMFRRALVEIVAEMDAEGTVRH